MVTLACTALPAGAASGQIDQEQGQGRAFCLRGRPAPACQTFLLLEGNVFTPVAGSRFSRIEYNRGTTTRSLELSWHVAWELGGMQNVSPNTAVGAAVLVGADANGSRIGFRGRYRRWMDETMALDVGAGWLRAHRSTPRVDQQPGNDHAPATGVTADVALGLTEWASVGVRADVLFSEEGDPATAYYVGTRLGTRPTLVATAVPVVLAALMGLFVMSGGVSM